MLPDQAKAQDGVDERAATARVRKGKRKSAEMEGAAAAPAAISLTASAHASTQDAPRCARHAWPPSVTVIRMRSGRLPTL